MATNPEPFTTEFEEYEPDNAMSDDELASHLESHALNTVGQHDDSIAAEQETAIDYYYRRMPDLPAADGCSSVVDGTVAIVIDNALAAILKPFVSSDETVSFAPRSQEDVEIADQATEYCNYVFNYDNPGFTILHNWFKDALLTKVGIVKCWWEETERVEREQLVVDNEIALAIARESEDYQSEAALPDGTFLVEFARIVPDGRVKIVNIPPEEWEITKFARSLEDAAYMAHVPRDTSRSDLIEMGFDPEVVESLPATGVARAFNQNTGREEARRRDENGGGSTLQLGSPHESQEYVDIRDEYVRIDYDGDGIAELRRVVRSGDVILLNEEIDELPFAVLCPVPMPHKVIGMSLADQVVDLQRISTAIWRQTLDNLYKTNNPRPVVGEGAERADGSTQDSIGDNAPGSEVLLRDISQFRYEAVPFFARESFGMLEYVEGQQEARTGIGRTGQGMDPNALKGPMTATEVATINSGRNARAEMIARIFAETGVKDLFKLILKLVVRYQPKERIIRLRNKWVPVDPSGWSTDMDMEISVGLGMGDKQERLMVAGAILQDYAALAQSPYSSLIDGTKVYNALKMKLSAADIKNVDDFLNEPQEGVQQQEQPNPEMMKLQAEMQAKQQQQQFDNEIRAQAQQFEQTLAEQKAIFEAQLAMGKAEAEAALAEWKAGQEVRLKQNLTDNRPGGDLDK